MVRASDEESGDQLQQQGRALLQVLVLGVLRRPFVICAVAALGVLFGLFKAVVTPNQYRSAGKLLVRPGGRDVIVSEATLPGVGEASRFAGTREAVLNEMQVLSSPALFDLVVERIGVDSILVPFAPEDSDQNASLVTKSLHRFQRWWFGGPSEAVRSGAVDRARVASEVLERSVIIVPEAGTSVISIFYLSHAPEVAQRILNGVLDVARDMHGRMFDTVAGVDRIESEAAAVEAKARQAEQALREFRAKCGVYDLESQLTDLQAYVSELTRQVDTLDVNAGQAQAERDALRKAVEVLPMERIAPGSAETVVNPNHSALANQLGYLKQSVVSLEIQRSGGLSDSTYKQLKAALEAQVKELETQLAQTSIQLTLDGHTEPHPERVRLAQRLVDVEFELAAVAQRRADLAQVLAARTKSIAELQALAPRLRDLELDAAQKRSAADRFAEGLANLRTMTRLEQLNLSNVQIMQRATYEPQKIAPNRGKLLVSGAAGGGAAGVLLAALLALLDRRLRSGADLVRSGVPADGVVRAAGDDARGAEAAARSLPPELQSAAADIAELWTHVPYDPRSRDGIVLAVLPCGGNDAGAITGPLAVGLAHFAGERVAHVSCREGRSWLATRLSLPERVSWAEAARGAVPAKSAACSTKIPGLDHFALGENAVDAPHPAAGPTFRAFLDALRTQYRFVVVELPSLGDGPAAQAALGAIDAVQVVAQVGVDDRRQVVKAVQAARSAGARVLGGVLMRGRKRAARAARAAANAPAASAN